MPVKKKTYPCKILSDSSENDFATRKKTKQVGVKEMGAQKVRNGVEIDSEK